MHWLYQYVFRGLGTLMVIGMLTLLFLALASRRPPSHTGGPSAPAVRGR